MRNQKPIVIDGCDMDTECWRDAPGFESIIEVSNYGRVRSKLRSITFSDAKPDRIIGGKILAAQIDRCGYARIRLGTKDSKVTVKVHRLVAEAFVENHDGKPQVNHIDGNKENNQAQNLEWATNSENQLHANSTGLRKSPSGAKSVRYKGDIIVCNASGEHVATLKSRTDMVAHGFDYRLVSNCVLGKRKTHKGCTFTRISIENFDKTEHQ